MSGQHSLAEVLHRALKFLQVYGPEDPKAQVVLKGVKQILDEQIVFSEQLEIDASLGRQGLLLNGQPMDGPPHSIKALAQALTERSILRLTFRKGLQSDELKLLFFILQLRPQRLQELGGALTFQGDLGPIQLEEGRPEAPTLKLPTGPVPHLSVFGAQEKTASAEPPPTPPVRPRLSATVPLGDLARLLSAPPKPPPPVAESAPPAASGEPEAPRQPIKVRIAAPVPDETVYLTPPAPPEEAAAPPQAHAPPPPSWAPANTDIPVTMPAPMPVPLEDDLVFAPLDLLEPNPSLLLPSIPPPEVQATLPEAPTDPAPATLPVPPPPPPPPPSPVLLPEPPAPPPAEPAGPPLSDRLHTLLENIHKAARPALVPGFEYPFATDHVDGLRRAQLGFADLSPLAGISDHLGLSKVDPVTLRDALRQGLGRLASGGQGALLLGIPTFPLGEQGLRRAFDYLAPEMLAQATAEIFTRDRLNTAQLAFLVATLQLCVRDRDLSLEALKGRLQFEGWGIEELEELQEAIKWEAQGTDTKLRSALDAKKDLLDLDPTQVMGLARQTLRRGDLDGVGLLLDSFEAGLQAKDVSRRAMAARFLADFSDCVEDPGIPGALLVRIHLLIQKHLREEKGQEALLWSCHAMESLLGFRMRSGDFSGAYREIQSLLDMGAAHLGEPDLDWKVNAFQDLVVRLAGPLNMAALVPLIHDSRFAATLPQLHSLFTVLGQPAARYLVVCLGIEEDRDRRSQLIAALKTVGRKASLPLREALRSSDWFMARNAVELIGDVQDGSAFDEVALCLKHADARVRQAALETLRNLDPARAAQALGAALSSADAALQLEIVAALGGLGQDRAVPDLLAAYRATRPGTESERLRLRILEALAALKNADAIPVLQSVFKKKGLLTRLEPVAVRLAAAKALSEIGTRESKEAMALALDIESADEVRAVLRQFLVGGS